ncbi:hypothetical protein JL722_10892 [Aureococcus anophagefferens]|nr:hypothetical protein JL722_10892 [Aureococcus anophagefferens]
MRAVLVAVLLRCAAARIRRVEVRALGTTPRLGGPLATPAAQKVLGAGPKRATNDKTRKALAEDAAKWFGSRGYVVDNVGVSVEGGPDGETVVLSAAVLPCGPVRLRTNSSKGVRTRAATVAKRMGLNRRKPFRWDAAKLAKLTEEETGLFVRSGTRAKASVENSCVAVDMVVEEPRYVSLTPEVEINADSARLFLRVVDRNVLGMGAEAQVEAAYSKQGAPEFTTQVTQRSDGGRSWMARLKPLGSRALTTKYGFGDGLSAQFDVEEIPPLDDDDSAYGEQDEGPADAYVAFPRVAAATLRKDGRRAAYAFACGDRVGSRFAGPFARAGAARSRRRARSRGGAAPYDRMPWDRRKDALGDAFEGALVGALLEASAPVAPDVTAFAADGAVAADWADGLPVADAAFGLAFQASMLRVDLTKRVGDPFNRKPALTLKLADARNRLKAP